MATRRCCCQASGPEACSGSLCHHQTKTDIPRNWKSAGATTVGPESPHKERIASFRGRPCNKEWLRQTTLGNAYKLPPTLLLVVRRSETAYTTLACVQGVQSEEQP
eukprot:GHVL01006955.1.p2 GENE.GHVL01006955.1~~GHVL01006955.1.p2  ORF type:complete len:106 (-),score=2.33 GHVL01006955.1:413-730(-)